MRPSLFLIGALLGSLSLVWLMTHGFGIALAPSLQSVLEGYEHLMSLLSAWLAPLIEQGRATLAFDLHLYPHWAHVFVLLALFFGADIRHAAVTMRPASALVLAVWGLAIAIAASVVAGSIPSESQDGLASATLLAYPVFGTALYQAGWCLLEASNPRGNGGTVRGRFWLLFTGEVVPILLGGAVAVVACANAGSIGVLPALPEPGLALLVVSIVALALFHLSRGVVFARDRAAGESWWRAFGNTGSAQLASVMLGAIGGAAIFLAANAWLAAS